MRKHLKQEINEKGNCYHHCYHLLHPVIAAIAESYPYRKYIYMNGQKYHRVERRGDVTDAGRTNNDKGR